MCPSGVPVHLIVFQIEYLKIEGVFVKYNNAKSLDGYPGNSLKVRYNPMTWEPQHNKSTWVNRINFSKSQNITANNKNACWSAQMPPPLRMPKPNATINSKCVVDSKN